jgi:hypothetical protein
MQIMNGNKNNPEYITVAMNNNGKLTEWIGFYVW